MNFKKIFESVLFEDKTSLIKNKLVLPDISDETEKEEFKNTLVDFFKKHPNYENKIDWNKAKTLTKADFQKVLDLEGTSKKAQRSQERIGTGKDPKTLFQNPGKSKFLIVGENPNWLFVAPLNYHAAVFCDSIECGGQYAKWCIGTKNNTMYWKRYIEDENLFIMAFNKNFETIPKKDLWTNLKYMIQKDDEGKYHIWNQKDVDTGSDLKTVKSDNSVLNEMFEKVQLEFDKESKEISIKANLQYEKKLKKIRDDRIEANIVSEKVSNYISEIKIPDTFTKLGDFCFSHMKRLEKIEIPNSITSIGSYSFFRCEKLKSITIPDSINIIGYGAFSICENLESITLGNSLIRISEKAFSDCEKLTSIEIPNSVKIIGREAFSHCKSLSKISLPDSLTKIEPGAFFNCDPFIVLTVSKNFDQNLLKDTGLPSRAKIETI